MSNEDQQARIKMEISKGNHAKHAYNSFIKQFCEDKRRLLFDNFRALPLTAELEIMEVKRMLAAVDTLDDDINTIINTGKLAEKMIADEVKH